MHAALDVVDRVGLGALTIRGVATAVSAPPMSLYTHFANKQELLDLMYTAVAERMYIDSGCETWQAELSALVHHIREVLLAHPRWTPILSRHTTPSVIAVRERILAMMVAKGFSAPAALTALSTMVLSTIGLVLLELTFRQPNGECTLRLRFEALKKLFDKDAENLTTSRQAVAQSPPFELGGIFDMSVDTLIRGLEQSVSPDPSH